MILLILDGRQRKNIGKCNLNSTVILLISIAPEQENAVKELFKFHCDSINIMLEKSGILGTDVFKFHCDSINIRL